MLLAIWGGGGAILVTSRQEGEEAKAIPLTWREYVCLRILGEGDNITFKKDRSILWVGMLLLGKFRHA